MAFQELFVSLRCYIGYGQVEVINKNAYTMEKILQAINKWIEKKEYESINSEINISTILPFYKGMIDPGDIREQAIGMLWEKSENAQAFFKLLYSDGEIDIEKNLHDTLVACVLEGLLTQLGFKEQKLNDKIKKYVDNAIVDIDLTQIYNCLDKVKDWRNKIHADKKTGKPATNDEWMKAWKVHIIGLLIIAYVEYNKTTKKDSIIAPLKNWYNNYSSQVFGGMPEKFKNKYVKSKDEELFGYLFTIITQDKELDKLSNTIFNLLDDSQKLTSPEGLPNMEDYIKLFLDNANRYIYTKIYEEYPKEANQSLDQEVETLGKLCIQTSYKYESVVREVKVGCKNIEKIANIVNDKEKVLLFDTSFFRTIFLIASLKQAFYAASTGACFFTKINNVQINPKGNENDFDVLPQKDSPFYYNFPNNKFRKGINSLDLQVKLGKDGRPVPFSIGLTKDKWHIIFIYKPQNGNSLKIDMVKKVRCPGLLDFDELWDEIVKDKEKDKKDNPESVIFNGDIKKNEKKDESSSISSINGEISSTFIDQLQQNKKEFNYYKEINKKALYEEYEGLVDNINELVKAIDSLPYDEDKNLEGNKTAIETELIKIRTELENLRRQSQIKSDKSEFERCKEDYIKKIQELRGSDERCQRYKETAKNEIEFKQFDESKDLLNNKKELNNIYDNLYSILEKRNNFENEKQKVLSELERLKSTCQKGNTLKKNAKNRIMGLAYDESVDSKANKAALYNIFDSLKSDLSRIGYGEIAKERANRFFQWVDKNWKWCATVFATIILAVFLMTVFDGNNRVKVPTGETIPSLESNTWRISIMDGKRVFESAVVSSISGSNTHYDMRHITETGKEIIITFNVDWQTGIVMSPELGEGRIEKNTKLNELNIIFEKWTITRNY